MLTKMPTEIKSETEPSQVNTAFFAGVVVMFAVMGMVGGYMVFPLIQSPNVPTLTTNNTTNVTSPTVKHSSIVSDSDVKSSQNNTGNNPKTTNKSTTSKQTNISQNKVQKTNNNM